MAFAPSAASSTGQVIAEEIGWAGVDPYSGGDEFYLDPAIGVSDWQPFASFPQSTFADGGVQHIDVAFVTYAAVPEPSTLAVFCSWIVLAGLSMYVGRRRPLRLKKWQGVCMISDD